VARIVAAEKRAFDMVKDGKQENMWMAGESDTRPTKDGRPGGDDHLLELLSSGHIARRIMDAARLAAAQHMKLRAHTMPSPVEAENSAQ